LALLTPILSRFPLFLGEAVIEAADIVVIPFRADKQGWHGVLGTMEWIERLNARSEVILLPTMFDLRQRQETVPVKGFALTAMDSAY
jgi:cellulose biosynthesis protein BcsQ